MSPIAFIPLGELAQKITVGYVGPMVNEYVIGGVPFLRSLNVRPFYFDPSDLKFISQKFHKKIIKSVLNPGDVVVVRTGNPGASCVIPGTLTEANCSDLVIIRCGKNIDPYFTSYYINSVTNSHIKGQVVGAIQKHFNIESAKKILFPDINIKQQIKILKILFNLDAKIDCNNRINAELEAMAKMLYDYWFVQFEFPDENGKPYKSSGGKMVYNEVLKREIPVDWKNGSLWGIAKYTNGLALQNYRPKDAKYLPVIKIKEMSEGVTDKTEKASIDVPESIIIDDGDVLFSWSATLDVKIWANGKGALNQHIFKVTSDKFPKIFYYFELLAYLSHFKMMAEKRKTTMGHITLDHLKQSTICIPPKALLQRMQKYIEPMFAQSLRLKQENLQLTKLRDWLLPMLMNGQVTVVDDVDKKSVFPAVTPSENKYDQRFATWRENQALAARGSLDEATLRELFDAMDDDDK